MSSSQTGRAFSTIDLLIAVAIIGVLCGLALPALSGTRSAAADYRLQSQVDTINRAIVVHQAQGGSIGGLRDPNAILARIKSHDARSTGLVFFLGGADQMIDLRLMANLQTADEAGSNQARAVWNPAEQKFVVTREGLGVKQFVVNGD